MNGKAAASRYSSGNVANYDSYNPKPKPKSTGLGLRAKQRIMAVQKIQIIHKIQVM